MKKILRKAAAVMAAVLFAGCQAIDIAEDAAGMEHSETISDNISAGRFAMTDCNDNDIPSIRAAVFYSASVVDLDLSKSNLTSIPANMFSDCTKLRSIILPDSVKNVGTNVFSGCTSLNKITMPYTIAESIVSDLPKSMTIILTGKLTDTSIIKNTLKKSNYFIDLDLTKITGLTRLPESAFEECEKLTSIKLPNTVTVMGAWAFYYCSNLRTITLSNTLTIIGIHAFDMCEALNRISIPNSVYRISHDAFSECKSLTGITLSNSLRIIEDCAFNSCTSLKTVTIPASVEWIDMDAFSGCSSLKELVFENHLWYRRLGYGQKTPTDLSNPETNAEYFSRKYSQYNWHAIEEKYTTESNAPSVINSLTTDSIIVVTGTITNSTIQNIKTALKNTSYNVYLDLSKTTGLTSLPESAFEECEKLISIKLPNSITYIGMNAFCECTSLKEIALQEGITHIYNYAFHKCSSLKKISFPNSLKYIYGEAFSECNTLEQIVFPNSLISIGHDSFSGCSSLKSLTLSNSLKTIEDWAFSGCSALEEITIPKSVEAIYEFAFSGCSSLTRFVFEDTVSWYRNTTIAKSGGISTDLSDPYINVNYLTDKYSKYNWYTCKTEYATVNTLATVISSLKGDASVVLTGYIDDSDYSTIWSAIQKSKYNISLDLGRVTLLYDSIPNGSFSNLENLERIVLPQGITKIESKAFKDCESLVRVIIPESVEWIDDYVFDGCTALKSIIFENPSPWYRTTDWDDWHDKFSSQKTKKTNLSIASKNVTYFTDTYYDYMWFRP